MKRLLLIALCAILLFCTGCGAKVSKSYATYGESLLEAVDAYLDGKATASETSTILADISNSVIALTTEKENDRELTSSVGVINSIFSRLPYQIIMSGPPSNDTFDQILSSRNKIAGLIGADARPEQSSYNTLPEDIPEMPETVGDDTDTNSGVSSTPAVPTVTLDSTSRIRDLGYSFSSEWFSQDGEDSIYYAVNILGTQQILITLTKTPSEIDDDTLSTYYDINAKVMKDSYESIIDEKRENVTIANIPALKQTICGRRSSFAQNDISINYYVYFNSCIYSICANQFFGESEPVSSIEFESILKAFLDSFDFQTSENTIQKSAAVSETLSQTNAVKMAKSYLEVMPFSYTGLIRQLEYEKFSHEDAVYAADNCGADWNEQAAKMAQSYLDVMAFSRDGLIAQLEYEGFTTEQATYGVDSVGL